jgi:hypothetical protein
MFYAFEIGRFTFQKRSVQIAGCIQGFFKGNVEYF